MNVLYLEIHGMCFCTKMHLAVRLCPDQLGHLTVFPQAA